MKPPNPSSRDLGEPVMNPSKPSQRAIKSQKEHWAAHRRGSLGTRHKPDNHDGQAKPQERGHIWANWAIGLELGVGGI
jgi:hypothetical protein